MKNKKGFTLVELLAVIAILAVLVIIALPNVLKMFRNAKQNTFANEVQNLVRSAEDKYLTSSLLSGKNTCFDSKTNPLDMSGRENINYLIKLTNKGKVIEVKVMDDSYQLLIDNENGINKADIGNKYKVESRNKTTDILDCNNSFLVQGEEGTGEEGTPYKIQYIEDLVELSNNVKSGQTYTGKTFVLSRNLDFKNKDSYKDKNNSELYTQLTAGAGFTPIGLKSTFSGTFDGKNHRIDNLYINRTEENSGDAAFIGTLINGSVKNLTVQGKVETNAVNNVLGGIVGRIEKSTIDNCVNEVIVTNKKGTYATGGVAGWSSGDATIKNSTNKANITGGAYTGGIIAANQGGTLTIEKCKNYGTITNEAGNSSAGIVAESGVYGEVKKTIIKNSTNYGDIISTNTSNTALYLGGLVGKSLKELEITNSSNENNKISSVGTGATSIGGIVGEVRASTKIDKCHNTGVLTNKNTNIGVRFGGIIGFAITVSDSITINNSYNTGNIENAVRSGGIIGELQAKSIIHNSYNKGNISSSIYWTSANIVGGLIGQTDCYSVSHDKVIILNSYNTGKLEITDTSENENTIGGLVGQNDSNNDLVILNSYNSGNLVGTNNNAKVLAINGIVRMAPKSVTLSNVYNIGTLSSKKDNYIVGLKNPNATVSYKNVYYLNSLNGTLPDDTTNVIGKSENEMKNQTFVTLLNSNKNSINLTEIDSNLSGYSLCDWKLGVSGYPELDCK